MIARRISLVLVASIALCGGAFAQGTGGGGGAGGNGTATGSSTTGVGTGATGSGTALSPNGPQVPGSDVGTRSINNTGVAVPDGTTTGMGPNAAVPPGSPAAAQARRNAGAGLAPNGVPIGSPGSGLGSPEQPIDPRVQ